jgi:hypothetical protein
MRRECLLSSPAGGDLGCGTSNSWGCHSYRQPRVAMVVIVNPLEHFVLLFFDLISSIKM